MASTCDYPLRFKPLLRRYLWGGRRLASMLGKTLGDGDDYAESWELVDHGKDQSVVTQGPLAGKTLRQLVADHPRQLFGESQQQTQFPLLLKFLDCHRTLSVQVHPNDQQAALLDPPDLGKTEAWIVLAADPGSLIYAGLKPGISQDTMRQALQQGACEKCLHAFEPHVGDCVFIEAGTVHALGAGLVIAEIQQASDTTFRLFDWNRTDAKGNPRQLHVEQSLATIDFTRGPVHPCQPQPTDRPDTQRMVACDKFVMDRITLEASRQLGGDGRFHLLALLEGSIAIEGDPAKKTLVPGETCLLPAAAEAVQMTPRQGRAVLLDIFLP